MLSHPAPHPTSRVRPRRALSLRNVLSPSILIAMSIAHPAVVMTTTGMRVAVVLVAQLAVSDRLQIANVVGMHTLHVDHAGMMIMKMCVGTLQTKTRSIMTIRMTACLRHVVGQVRAVIHFAIVVTPITRHHDATMSEAVGVVPECVPREMTECRIVGRQVLALLLNPPQRYPPVARRYHTLRLHHPPPPASRRRFVLGHSW